MSVSDISRVCLGVETSHTYETHTVLLEDVHSPPEFLMDSSAASAGPPHHYSSGCGGHQLPDKCPAQRGPPPRCAELEAGVSRRAQQICIRATAGAAQLATDTLSVAWLRGVFRHDARASQAAFRDYVSCLDDVYADERASGVPAVATRARELSREMLTSTPAVHRLSGCATHSTAMALSLYSTSIDKLVWLC